MFSLNQICPNKVLRNLSAELLSRYGFIHKFKVSDLDITPCHKHNCVDDGLFILLNRFPQTS